MRWILSAIIWLVVLVYLTFGVLTSVWVYGSKAETGLVKKTVKFYPLPVAIVNGGMVWAKDYYQQLDYIRQFSSKTKQAVPDEAALRGQIIDQLAENKLLQIQAIHYKVSVSDKDVNDAYQKIVDQSGGVSEVKKVLSELYGMTEKDFKVLVREQVLKEKIQNEVIAQVQVSHILIKDETRANEVATKAKTGEDFAALAKQYTEDSKSKDAGGELGFLAKGELVVNDTSIPEFDNAAFSANKGDIVGPVKTSIGFEIIKVEDKKGQINESFDTWFASIKNKSKVWHILNTTDANRSVAIFGLSIILGLFVIYILIALASLTLWIWALIDVIRRNFMNPKDKTLWIILVAVGIVTGPILPIIYLIIGRKKGERKNVNFN